jgi:Tol biopolymer transport system component
MSYRVLGSQPGQAVTDALYAVNVQTGERREMSRTAIRVRLSGRGGMEQDGDRWIYLQRGASGRLELRAADPATGTSSLVYAFPSSHEFEADARLLVHGDRIAYTRLRGDSLDLHLINATSGQQRKLASFSRAAGSAAWSWDGSQIAVADWLPGTPRRGAVHLVPVPAGTSDARRVRTLDVCEEEHCDLFTWTPDDSHVVMLGYDPNHRILKLNVRDGRLTTVLSGDQPQRVWEYLLSPDGRNVVYPVQRDAGSSVHVASFRSLVEARERR